MPSYNKVLRKLLAYANFDRVIFALIFAKLFIDYQEWECIETLHIVTVEYVNLLDIRKLLIGCLYYLAFQNEFATTNNDKQFSKIERSKLNWNEGAKQTKLK